MLTYSGHVAVGIDHEDTSGGRRVDGDGDNIGYRNAGNTLVDNVGVTSGANDRSNEDDADVDDAEADNAVKCDTDG